MNQYWENTLIIKSKYFEKFILYLAAVDLKPMGIRFLVFSNNRVDQDWVCWSHPLTKLEDAKEEFKKTIEQIKSIEKEQVT